MNASDRLHAAHRAVSEGQFEEALDEYVWFHEHALEEEPALYGVRLSFALAYWIELADAYPRARQVLEEIRDRKTAALLRGEGNRRLFHDVESINENLGCTSNTYSLFVQLAASNPSLAESCVPLALPAIVDAGDYQLASRYLPDPERRINTLSKSLNHDIEELKQLPRSRAPRRDAYIHIYASEVQVIVTVLAGIGQQDEASRLQELASTLIKSASVRKLVRRALERES